MIDSLSAEQSETDRSEVVAGLVHGIAVLQALQKKPRVTQSELSALTGLTRATARRSLITLASLGYVEAEDGVYRLTPKVIEFATGYLGANDGWIAIATPYLEVLRNKVEENVSAVVLDRTDVVYVASFAADTVMSVNVRIGGRKPAYCTAMGRVLLAGMPEDCARDVLADEQHPAEDRQHDRHRRRADGRDPQGARAGFCRHRPGAGAGPRRRGRAGEKPARRDHRGAQHLRPHHADLAGETHVALPARGA